jgi:anti-anti-sigma regulatory factor
MHEDALRELERRARHGDKDAEQALEKLRERLGLGWGGEHLQEGVARGQTRGHYIVFGQEIEIVEPTRGLRVACTKAFREMPEGPPPAPYKVEPVDAALKAGIPWLLVDMHRAPTISSRSIAGMIKHADSFRKLGGGLVVVRLPDKIRDVLEILGLQVFLEIFSNREDALSAISARRRKK